MKFNAVIRGIKSVQKKFKELEKEQKKQTLIALTDSIFAVQKTAIDSINEKTGSRTVTRYNPKREQLVSDPGSPPNSDQGDLVRSLSRGVYIDKNKLEATLSSNLEYAIALEYGSKARNIIARPFLRPALLQNGFFIKEKFADSVTISVEKVEKLKT